jgi:hypothetical protein
MHLRYVATPCKPYPGMCTSINFIRGRGNVSNHLTFVIMSLCFHHWKIYLRKGNNATAIAEDRAFYGAWIITGKSDLKGSIKKLIRLGLKRKDVWLKNWKKRGQIIDDDIF